MVREVESPAERSRICATILRALPEWFGIESAIEHYVAEVRALPTLAAGSADEPAGFRSLKQHSPYAAEIYVMGVLREHHRAGIGTALVVRAEELLRTRDVEYLQVKTLAPANPSPNYARTRKFYEAIGFRPLEVFPTLWDEHNPCLLLVKRL